jgi:hypothetical protein
MLKVIHVRALEPAVVEDESERLDQIDRHAEAGAQPDQGAGILRDIGLEKGEAHLLQSFEADKRKNTGDAAG